MCIQKELRIKGSGAKHKGSIRKKEIFQKSSFESPNDDWRKDPTFQIKCRKTRMPEVPRTTHNKAESDLEEQVTKDNTTSNKLATIC